MSVSPVAAGAYRMFPSVPKNSLSAVGMPRKVRVVFVPPTVIATVLAAMISPAATVNVTVSGSDSGSAKAVGVAGHTKSTASPRVTRKSGTVPTVGVSLTLVTCRSTCVSTVPTPASAATTVKR